MNRLIEPEPGAGLSARFVADARGRQHPNGAGDHRRFVREDVPEHVFRHDHVEVGRVAYQVHRHGIDEHMLQGDIGELAVHLVRNRAPQPR